VILNCLGQKELIKDVPIEWQGQDILLVPILNHIKYLGKPIAGQSISYFSEDDQMDVYVGIEGQNIQSSKCLGVEEVTSANKQLKLTLNIKPQDKQAKPDVTMEKPAETVKHEQDSQMVAVSLPQMVTNSQFNSAIGNVTEPIKRERATRQDVIDRNKVSTRYETDSKKLP